MLSLYVNSISVALQALTVISMGNIADHRTSRFFYHKPKCTDPHPGTAPHRKLLLLFFAFFGSTAATLFLLLPSSSSIWPTSALLGICANVGFGASVVAMNAYLPTLARASEEVVKARADMLSASDESEIQRPSNEDDVGDASEPLLSSHDSTDAHTGSGANLLREAYNNALSRATSRISSLGIALGYAAGIVLLIIALIPVTKLHGTTFSLRLAIGLSGIWWATFSLPAAAWLPSGKKAKEAGVETEGAEWDEGAEGGKEAWSTKREIVKAWKRLGSMLRWREVKKLRNTFKFLAAWFLLSDGTSSFSVKIIILIRPSRLYHYHIDSDALRENVSKHARDIVGTYRDYQPRRGHRGLTRLATHSEGFGLVKPTRACHARVPCESASRIWLPWIHSRIPKRHCPLRRAHYTCRDVRPLGLFCESSLSHRYVDVTSTEPMYGMTDAGSVGQGAVYGAFQGYARAFYSELIPHGEEARWYALYSITDKVRSLLVSFSHSSRLHTPSSSAPVYVHRRSSSL